MGSEHKRVGIIGAGVAGLLSIKYCLEEGLTPVCFEQHDQLGGTWYYTEHERENQTASTYQNMHQNEAKCRMAFSDYPIPEHYPHFLSVAQYHEYLMSYAKHFDLLRHIRFNQTVTKVRKADDYSTTGRWEVLTRPKDEDVEEINIFDAISICSGANTRGFIPDIPGMSDFGGKVIHSTQYRRPEDFAGQQILVVGGKFSASDIACDLSKQAPQVYWSLNREMIFMPLSINGRGNSLHVRRCDVLTTSEKIGEGFKKLATSVVNHAELGLEVNRNPFLDGNLTTADGLMPCLLTGRIQFKPRVESFTQDSVIYADGTTQRIDAVIMATGWITDYSFVDCPDIEGDDPANFMLYKGVFPLSCTHPTLAVLSARGVLGSYTCSIEVAARWLTRVFAGKCQLPPKKKKVPTATLR